MGAGGETVVAVRRRRPAAGAHVLAGLLAIERLEMPTNVMR